MPPSSDLTQGLLQCEDVLLRPCSQGPSEDPLGFCFPACSHKPSQLLPEQLSRTQSELTLHQQDCRPPSPGDSLCKCSLPCALFENTAKKATSSSLIMQQCLSFIAAHTVALQEWQPGCARGKAFERNGIIKELLSGRFFVVFFFFLSLSQLFLFSGFGSRVPSCIALLLPDSIFPLGFFLLLIAGHNNQLKKRERERQYFWGCFSFQESNSSRCLICRHQLEANIARQSSSVFPARRWREHL